MADFPRPHQVAHGAHGDLQRRRVVFLVQIQDIDEIGAEAPQAGIGRVHDPFARQAALVAPLAHRVRDLGRQHPIQSARCDGGADDLLRLAGIVAIGGVDEIDARIERARDDAVAGRRIGRGSEQHRAEAQPADRDAAAAEGAIFHDESPASAQDNTARWPCELTPP
jgi:hypothetical protein